MPRTGRRQDVSVELAQASAQVLSILYSTAQTPSYVAIYACLHLELITATALMLLDDSEEVFLLSSLSLIQVFNHFLKSSCDIQAVTMSQQAIHQHTFKIALAIGEAFEYLTHIRYVAPRIHKRLQTFQQLKFDAVFNGTERNFTRHARMSEENFNRLAGLIRDDLVFHNSASVPQAPVEWQLMVTLYRLGHSGNGGSAYMIGQSFGISEGSVHNFTNRCFEAILKLENEYVYWPSQEERNEIKRYFGRKSFFKDCVGCIDGTLIRLSFAPVKNPEDFWTRKHIYALNSLLVSDHQSRIIYAKHGWCGSAHDQRVYNSTHLAQNLDQYFSKNEYLLADSGYTCSKNIIPTFKSPRLQSLDPLKRDFNRALSEQRVVSEHGNGQLKLRFQSLQDLRILIKDVFSATRATNWLQVCCILHNFTIEFKDFWVPDRTQNAEVEIGDGDVEPLVLGLGRNTAYARRNGLLEDFRLYRQHHHLPGLSN